MKSNSTFLGMRTLASLWRASTALACLTPALPAGAADRFWRNPDGGTFSIAAHWFGGSPVPGANDIVHFGLRTSVFEEPAYTVSFVGNATNQSLIVEDDFVVFNLNGHTYTCSESFGSAVGYVAGRTGRLTVSNGHVNLGVMTVGGTGPGSVTVVNGGTVQSDNFWRIGWGGSGGVSVNGSNCEWIHHGELSVGFGASGALNILNGGLVQNDTGLIADGANPGSVLVSGAGSYWINVNDLIVGNGGNATLTIDDGRVDCDSAHVGFVAGHTGAVSVSGNDGEWVIGEQVFIGDIGTGTLDISNGGTVTSPVAAIGAAEGSSGVVTVSGMADPPGVTFWLNLGDMNVGHSGTGSLAILDGGYVHNGNSFIGRFAGSAGHVTVDGIGSSWRTSGDMRVGGSAGAPGGTGQLDVSGGTVTVTGQFKIWNTPDTVVNLTGGTLNVGSLDTMGHPALFNWSGGTFQTNNPFAVDPSGPLGALVTISAGQSLTSSNLVGVSAGGQLTIAGGTLDIAHLNINGACSMTAGFVSTAQLSAGNLGYPNSGNGTGTIDLTGGTLTTGPVYLGSSAGGTGQVSVGGTGTLECSKLAANQLILNEGGTVIVHDPGPPIGEEPALYRSAAAGYFRNGAITIHGGTLTAPNIKLGIVPGLTGTYTQTGGTVNVDVFGVGNDGTLTGGAGSGVASVSGGVLSAGAVLLGSTANGSGQLTVSGTGDLTAGRVTLNELMVHGGSVTVVDPNPLGDGDDPVLYRSIVGGYLRSGSMTVNSGTVTTPNIKLGVTAGQTGTYSQTGGSVTVGVFSIGDDDLASRGGGTGSAMISGGALHADALQVGSLRGGTGRLHWSGGMLTGHSLQMAGAAELGVALGGTVPGSGYTQLQLTGSAELTGTLAVTRAGGFEPGLGDTFIVLSADSITGAYEHLTGVTAGPGKVFRVQYNATNVTLIVEASTPGDCDSDDDVDLFDYAGFEACLAGPLSLPPPGCDCTDLDGDGDVDLADFRGLQTQLAE